MTWIYLLINRKEIPETMKPGEQDNDSIVARYKMTEAERKAYRDSVRDILEASPENLEAALEAAQTVLEEIFDNALDRDPDSIYIDTEREPGNKKAVPMLQH